MKIDIAIIAISFVLLLVMNHLHKRLTGEINWLEGCEDSQRTVKIYRVFRAIISIFCIVFVGVLAYVYVFQ